ncbi:AAA family ATPase [Microbacteriaceae bacterium VKM Ac-2855]|nr:AAA family ATPase [Microbacteriaceae bacterium VKM Ac-2855]
MGSGVECVLLTGTVGVGKSTVGEAISDALGDRLPAHAVIDLDQIRRLRPVPADDRFALEVELANLAALVSNYRAVGAQRFVISGVVESAQERRRYEAALGGASILLVRLRAPADVVAERIRTRHATDAAGRDWHLDRAIELETVLSTAAFEDLLLDATAGPAESVREVLLAAGWAAA